MTPEPEPEPGWYWLSCPRFTVAVRVDDGVVREAPPIVRRFVGQSLSAMERWARTLGAVRVEKLGPCP
jgi:hypothetical protein